MTTFRGPPLDEEPGLGALTLPGLLDDVAARHGEREAVVFPGGDVRLSYRDLQEVDLTGADLTDAQLVGANLSRAVLRDACLAGARLDEARLTGADLRGADLSRARLARADLRDVAVEGSRWTRAALVDAVLPDRIAAAPEPRHAEPPVRRHPGRGRHRGLSHRRDARLPRHLAGQATASLRVRSADDGTRQRLARGAPRPRAGARSEYK